MNADRWPSPPAPVRLLAWEPVDGGGLRAVCAEGTRWTVREAGERGFSISLDNWTAPHWWAPSLAEAQAQVESFEARHDDPAVPALGCSWKQLETAHDELRAEAEALVREWVWGPNYAGWERFEPFFHEQHGDRPKTRRRRVPPACPSDASLFGFDADGAAVVSRRFRDGGQVEAETLRVRGVMLAYESTRARRLEMLHVPTIQDGALVGLDVWTADPFREGFRWWGMAYEHEGGRVVAMRSAVRDVPSPGWRHRHSAGSPPADLRIERRDAVHFDYGDDGQLATVTVDGEFIYRRRPGGAVARAARLVRAEYPERIAAWVARNAPDEPLACLAIRYGEAYNSPLPPGLALFTERELAERRAGGTSPLIDPIAFECMDFEPRELEDGETLLDAHQALNQDWRSSGDLDAPRRLLTAVAKAVAARTPDGPPVFAVDFELTDLERNLRASVPGPLRRRLAE